MGTKAVISNFFKRLFDVSNEYTEIAKYQKDDDEYNLKKNLNREDIIKYDLSKIIIPFNIDVDDNGNIIESYKDSENDWKLYREFVFLNENEYYISESYRDNLNDKNNYDVEFFNQYITKINYFNKEYNKNDTLELIPNKSSYIVKHEKVDNYRKLYNKDYELNLINYNEHIHKFIPTDIIVNTKKYIDYVDQRNIRKDSKVVKHATTFYFNKQDIINNNKSYHYGYYPNIKNGSPFYKK